MVTMAAARRHVTLRAGHVCEAGRVVLGQRLLYELRPAVERELVTTGTGGRLALVCGDAVTRRAVDARVLVRGRRMATRTEAVLLRIPEGEAPLEGLVGERDAMERRAPLLGDLRMTR